MQRRLFSFVFMLVWLGWIRSGAAENVVAPIDIKKIGQGVGDAAGKLPDTQRTPAPAWIRMRGGEIELDPRLGAVVEVRLDRTRGIDPLGVIDTLENADLQRLVEFPEVRRLTLESRHTMSDDGLRHAAVLSKLQSLNLSGTHITGAGLSYLAPLEHLEELNLAHCSRLEQAELRRLKKYHKLRTLKLDARADAWTVDSNWALYLRAIARGTDHGFPLPMEEELERCRGGLTDVGLEHVAQVPTLERLTLSRSRVTNRGVAQLVKLDKLEVLDLSYTRASGEGLRPLAKLPRLRRLVLNFTCVTDADAPTLTGFGKLESLSLDGTGISDEALKPIAKLTHLRQLSLQLCRGVTEEQVAGLQRALPECEIEYSQRAKPGEWR